ncbi:MAG: TIM barrel protein [Chitinivibrionales bacterium]|nr:TIM barrel protein [Chitinivibrionales bacterium]
MQWKYSVITGFLGRLKDRFIDYHPARQLDEMLAMAARIKGCEGVELVYPQDFAEPATVKDLLKQHNLGVAAVNLNVKSEDKWRFGSFTNPDPGIRAEAVDYLRRAMDIAADLGCNLVTSAFLNDGEDYPFETDFVAAFDNTVKGVAEGASHRDDVRVALEYKASEPRVHCLIGNAGKAAYIAQLTGRDNVGVNVDIGHALQSQEIPAESIAFLGATGKLFYVHINDNYRNWDWDLVPGTVNLWDYLELLFYLRRVGYDGWITADVFPQRHDQIRVMEKTFEWMDYCIAKVDKLDEKQFVEMMRTKDAFDMLDAVRELI